MHLFADEGVERQVVERLRQDGYQVHYVAEMDPGISDDEILQQANQAEALLVTADKDFGELVFRLGQAASGVVLLRLAGLSPDTKAKLVAAVFRQHADELQAAFSVVTPGGIRIRPHR